MHRAPALVASLALVLLAGGCAPTAQPPAPEPPAPPPPEPRVETITEVQVVEREPALEETWPGLLAEPLAVESGAGQLDAAQVEAVLSHLRDSGMLGDEELARAARERLRQSLALLMVERAEAAAAPVTPEQVRALYEARLAEFAVPDRASVRLIVVPSMAEADAILARTRSGEDFGALARELSTHPSRADGGSLPPFARGTYAAAMEELAFSLAPGEVGAVETSRGVFVVLKVAQASASTLPFEEVAPRLRAELEAEARSKAREEFLQRVSGG